MSTNNQTCEACGDPGATLYCCWPAVLCPACARDRTDKREAAIHEAGHAVAYHVQGGPQGRAWITPSGTADPINNKLWIGSAGSHFFKYIGSEKVAIVGFAGVIAEQIEKDSSVDWMEIEDWLEYESIVPSATDWQGIGAAFSDSDCFGFDDFRKLGEDDDSAALRSQLIQRSIKILKDNWDSVLLVAEHLAEHQVCTDWDLDQLVRHGRRIDFGTML